MRTRLTKGKKVQEKVDMHAYFTEKYKRMAAHRAKLKAAAVLKTFEDKTKIPSFKTTRDTVSNNSLVTNKLIIPNKLSLPATGYPGQIVYDASTAKYWGWTPNGWSDFAGGGGNASFERIGYPTSTIPSADVITTLIESGISGLASWGARVADVENDQGYSISVSDIGDIVVTGEYNSGELTVYNFDRSTAWTLSNSGDSDAFVVKYLEGGECSWVTRIASVNYDSGIGISINDSGDIVVTGLYTDNDLTVYNQNGAIAWTLPNSGGYDAFIVKYSSSGIATWATRIAGFSYDDQFGNSISINNNGDIVVTGEYTNEIAIYNQDASIAWTLANSDGYDAFIVKYSSSGIATWATRVAGTTYDEGYGISINKKGDILVTGHYLDNELIIYNNDGTIAWTLPNSGGYNAFIVKYSEAGIVNWATRIANSVNGSSVSITDSGDIVVTGTYFNTEIIVYNQDASIAWTLPNSGGRDAFIVKYSEDGIATWATQIAGVNSDFGNSISINNSGDIVITGTYNSELLIYNQNRIIGWTLPNSGLSDTFIARYSIDGIVNWAARVNNATGWGISINNKGDIVVTGDYTNEITVYNQDRSTALTLPSSGNRDAFIVKFVDEQLSTSLTNPSTDGQIKRIVSSGPQVTVSPVATVDNLTQSVLITNGKSVEMLWDATKENWTILKST